MTTLATPRSRTATPVTVPVRWVPWAAGVVAVVTRLIWAGRGLGSDEAGYLTVARQWSPGPSLYGRYWVDRPPLLITIDRLAAQLGGAPALRVTGAVAVLVTVLAVAAVVRRLTGSVVAAAWGAGCAAVLLASPVAGAYEVNGELLAAPFTTLGVLGVAVAAKARRPRERWTGGLLAGAGLAAAVLVKQNMVDVLVVAGAAALVALATRRVGLRAVMVAGAAAAGGAVAVGAAVLGWAAAHGTSPGGVWWAMYPFRVAAGETLAGSPGTAAHQRTLVMLACALVSGLLPALAVTVASWRRLGPRRAALLVVLVWTAWVGASIVLGGNSWNHYLVQLVPPVAVGVGLLAAERPRRAAAVVAACLVPALVSTALLVGTGPSRSEDETLGAAIGAAARPTDGIVVAWGHPAVVQASGLNSPYPSLWSLPTKTLDPRLTGLRAVLTGPHGPTWFVVRRSLPTWGLPTGPVRDVLHRDYHAVAHGCGATVYLRDGVVRPDPAATCG